MSTCVEVVSTCVEVKCVHVCRGEVSTCVEVVSTCAEVKCSCCCTQLKPAELKLAPQLTT